MTANLKSFDLTATITVAVLYIYATSYAYLLGEITEYNLVHLNLVNLLDIISVALSWDYHISVIKVLCMAFAAYLLFYVMDDDKFTLKNLLLLGVSFLVFHAVNGAFNDSKTVGDVFSSSNILYQFVPMGVGAFLLGFHRDKIKGFIKYSLILGILIPSFFIMGARHAQLNAKEEAVIFLDKEKVAITSYRIFNSYIVAVKDNQTFIFPSSEVRKIQLLEAPKKPDPINAVLSK